VHRGSLHDQGLIHQPRGNVELTERQVAVAEALKKARHLRAMYFATDFGQLNVLFQTKHQAVYLDAQLQFVRVHSLIANLSKFPAHFSFFLFFLFFRL